MSIRNRHRLIGLGFLTAISGGIGTAGLSFDARLDLRNLVVTVPFAIAAAAGSLRAPRISAAVLLAVAFAAFAIEARSASINYQACTVLSGHTVDLGRIECSPVGLGSLVIASIASGIAALLMVASARTGRAVLGMLAGILLAPVLIYVLSIATFVLRGA